MDSEKDLITTPETPVPKARKKRSKFREWLNAFIFAIFFISLVRWLAIEPFTIPTPSMEGTLLVGDYLFVSKLHYGARTPITPLQIPLTHQHIWWTTLPSYVDWLQFPYYRLQFPPFAWSKIQRNDVVVFNYPEKEDDSPMYPTDLKTNYIKRCVGLAGDTLEIKNLDVFINGKKLDNPSSLYYRFLIYADHEILPETFKAYGVHEYQTLQGVGYVILASKEQAERFKALSFVSKVILDEHKPQQRDGLIFPQDVAFQWNQDNFGPLIIPKKNAQIPMTKRNVALYAHIIRQYEGNEQVDIRQDKLYIGGSEVKRYTFKQNYYFMMGDSRHNSLDSRFWGFVPEDHIIGKAVLVLFSYDKHDSWWSPFRWERFFKTIE